MRDRAKTVIISLFIFVIAAVGGTYIYGLYAHREVITATIEYKEVEVDHRTDEDGMTSTSRTYYVHTRTNTYSVQEEAFSRGAPPLYRRLKEGKRYKLEVAGFRCFGQVIIRIIKEES